jgi:DNA end-binding protein Ku
VDHNFPETGNLHRANSRTSGARRLHSEELSTAKSVLQSKSNSGAVQMPARPYWRGQLRLALVSIPVEVYSATRSGSSVTFRQIHEPSGKPVNYVKSVKGIGPIDTDEIVRGFEYERGHFVLLDDQELDAIALESKKTLELTLFVPSKDIDIIYYEKPYFVVPADDLAVEAFTVLREALRKSSMVGIGQLAIRGREHTVALRPCDRGLTMETLRYADELTKAQSYFRDIPDVDVDPDLLEMAEALVERKTGSFDPTAFRDHYVDSLDELVQRKLHAKGRKIVAEKETEPAASGSNVIDLMAALKKSLEKPAAGTAKKSGGRKRA